MLTYAILWFILSSIKSTNVDKFKGNICMNIKDNSDFQLFYLIYEFDFYYRNSISNLFEQKNLKITFEEFDLLNVIYNKKNIGQPKLAQLIALLIQSNTDITIIINSLKNKNFLGCETGGLSVTEKGKEKLQEAYQYVWDFNNKMIKDLTKKELIVLNKFLKLSTKNLSIMQFKLAGINMNKMNQV